MGGAKGTGAFAKGTTESATLLQLFLTKKLEITAEPGDVTSLFPTLADKTASQFRSGFNRVRDAIKETLSAMEQGEANGIFFLFFCCHHHLMSFCCMWS
jgi:hypothetical protein